MILRNLTGPLSSGMITPLSATPVSGVDTGYVEESSPECRADLIDAYSVLATPVGYEETGCDNSPIDPYSVFVAGPTGFDCKITCDGAPIIIKASGNGKFSISDAAIDYINKRNNMGPKLNCALSPLNPFTAQKQVPLGFKCFGSVKAEATGSGSFSISQSALAYINYLNTIRPTASGSGSGSFALTYDAYTNIVNINNQKFQIVGGKGGVHKYAYGQGTFALTKSAYENILTINDVNAKNGLWSLNAGTYKIDYLAYLGIKMSLESDVYIGSDVNGERQADAIFDYTKFYDTMVSDTRVGETIPSSGLSLTKNYFSVVAPTKDDNTLSMIRYNQFPFVDTSDYIRRYSHQRPRRENVKINEMFDYSSYFDKPYIIDNAGYIDGRTEGEIDLWINPTFDMSTDPLKRYYFDAQNVVTQDFDSTTDSYIIVNENIDHIVSVKTYIDDIDYLNNGSIELNNTGNATERLLTPTNLFSVTVSEQVLQVLYVRIASDSGRNDYFGNGTIATTSSGSVIYLENGLPSNLMNVANSIVIGYRQVGSNISANKTKIIRYGRRLPKANMKVRITYIPKGFNGDRISLYKDIDAALTFSIRGGAGNKLYATNLVVENLIKTPVDWSRNTWHKVKIQYRINSTNDVMRLFVDGYEYGAATQRIIQVNGTEEIIQQETTSRDVDHQGTPPNEVAQLTFRDDISSISIGCDAQSKNICFALIDNFKISNRVSPDYAPFGEAYDPAYSSNLENIMPNIPDAYTTYMLDNDRVAEKVTDFTSLVRQSSGSNDFTLTVTDTFGIIEENSRHKDMLEVLVKQLKPANSRAFIKYTK